MHETSARIYPFWLILSWDCRVFRSREFPHATFSSPLHIERARKSFYREFEIREGRCIKRKYEIPGIWRRQYVDVYNGNYYLQGDAGGVVEGNLKLDLFEEYASADGI